MPVVFDPEKETGTKTGIRLPYP